MKLHLDRKIKPEMAFGHDNSEGSLSGKCFDIF